MKMLNSLVVVAIALVLAFAAPLRAHYQPQDYLSAHNRARADVKVSSLVWSKSLASYARRYAMQRSTDCKLILSRGPYGEILAWSSTGFTAEQAVNYWVSGKSNYNYATNTCIPGTQCEAYTQVVWKNTVSLGCATVRCGSGTFTVCSYDPAGNIPGQRPY